MSRREAAATTLADLRTGACWVWLYCEGRDCHHSAPMALAPPIIRWGADGSSDLLRQRVRCTQCGSRGATLRAPSWGGELVGVSPFPVETIRAAVNLVVKIRHLRAAEV